MSRKRFAAGFGLLSFTLGGVMLTSMAQAQSFLVGAYLFGANASGATNSTNYQYDTNTNSSDLALAVNGNGKGFTQALSAGANNFTFSFSQQAFALSPTGDLGLFFSTTNTPYAPSTAARTPDLIVARDVTGALAFFTPSAGTTLNDYHYQDTTVLANGLTAFNVGGNTVTVTAYSVNSTPTGTFTLNVAPTAAPTPEPGVVGLLSGLCVSGGVFAFRRRRTTKK